MAGPLKTYAFINAKLRTRISKILPQQFIRQLIRCRSLAESVQLLGETDFAPVQKGIAQADPAHVIQDDSTNRRKLFRRCVYPEHIANSLYEFLGKYCAGLEINLDQPAWWVIGWLGWVGLQTVPTCRFR